MTNQTRPGRALNSIAVFALMAFSSNAMAGEDRPQDGIQIRVVFFYPSDAEPPQGAKVQLGKYADFAQHFFTHWLNHWGYDTKGAMPFHRQRSGELDVVFVKGKHREGSEHYRGEDGGLAKEAANRIVEEVKEHSDVGGENQVMWIFLHKILGDEAGLAIGRGSTTSGGVCLIKFRPADTFTNETNISSTEGKAADLRGVIHELGHALGLPHNGSHSSLQLGSSLMGKPDREYKKKYPNDFRVYLTKASAAMIWKSSVFAGNANGKERSRVPKARIGQCKFSYDGQSDRFKISGIVESNMKVHSVVIANQQDCDRSSYFHKFFASRTGEDGSFEISVDELKQSNGNLVIAFCFENGFVGGHPGGRKSSIKSGYIRNYQFNNGSFSFADDWANNRTSRLQRPR